jgi:hypothetical protein
VTVTWGEFAKAEPELAQFGAERFAKTGLCLLGTTRANGFPRISPVEPLIHAERLYLGMMWRSRKALDLLRDPRCVVHNTVADKSGTEGDFKLYGVARDVQDPDERESYGAALKEAIGWRPDTDYHLFEITVAEIGWYRYDGAEQHDIRVWRPTWPAARRRRADA